MTGQSRVCSNLPGKAPSGRVARQGVGGRSLRSGPASLPVVLLFPSLREEPGAGPPDGVVAVWLDGSGPLPCLGLDPEAMLETSSRLDDRRVRLPATNRGAPQEGWDYAHATQLPQAHRRVNDRVVRGHAGRLDAAGDGPDPGRHARPRRRAEVPNRDADSPGDAQSGNDHDAGRQAGRLLRDLHAAVLPADPACGHGGHHRVGVRGRQLGEPKGAAAAPRALADDRVEVEAAGADQVDQRPEGLKRQLPAASAAGGPDAALGQPTRRGRGPCHAAGIHLHARPVHRTGTTAVLPGPAPNEGDQFPPNKTYYEIPIAVQDRSFNTNGALFYPDTRAFFDGIEGPYIPDTDVSPIWNPEFFGNMIIANGNTWPFQTVEQRRYRLRFLNVCPSRFLSLDFSSIPGVEG